MTKEKVLVVRRILQQQYKTGKINKKRYNKELKWIVKNILSND
jgi:hypothetical protein